MSNHANTLLIAELEDILQTLGAKPDVPMFLRLMAATVNDLNRRLLNDMADKLEKEDQS